jgi:uncharacterized integral membrane protein
MGLDREGPASEGDNNMRNLKLVVSLVLLAMLVIFSIQNAEVLGINFLFWSLQVRRALLLFLVLAIGIVIGWVLRSLRRAEPK